MCEVRAIFSLAVLAVLASFVIDLPLVAASADSFDCSVCEMFLDSDYQADLNVQLSALGQQIHKVSTVEIDIVGVNFSRPSIANSTLYDPSWWVWSKSISEYYFSVPALDMDVISFGTLKISVRNLKLNLKDSPSGCAAQMQDQCRSRQLARLILQALRPIRRHLTTESKSVCNCGCKNATASTEADNDRMEHYDNTDVLCESHFLSEIAYTRGGETVGWRCVVLTNNATNRIQSGEADLAAMMLVATRQDLKLITFIFGCVFPLIIILIVILQRWQQWNLMKQAREIFLTEGKYDPECAQLFELNISDTDLSSTAGNDMLHGVSDCYSGSKVDSKSCRYWVVLQQRSIIDYRSPVSFISLYFKVKLKLLKTLAVVMYSLFIIMTCWWYKCYVDRADRFAFLHTGTQIWWNLSAICVSWLIADSSTWTYYFMVTVLSVSFMSCVAQTLRTIVNCSLYYSLSYSKKRKAKWDNAINRRIGITEQTESTKSSSAGKAMRDAAVIFYILLSLLPLVVITHNLSHCFVYLILGLLVHIQTTAPLVMGIVLAVYYIGWALNGLNDKYTFLKSALFDAVLSKLQPVEAVNVKQRPMRSKRRNTHCRESCSAFSLVPICLKRQVVFFDTSRHEPYLTVEQFREVSNFFAPFKQEALRAVSNLLITMLTAWFMLLGILGYNKTLYGQNMTMFMTGLVSLLSAMIPKLVDLCSTNETRRLETDALKYLVKRYVQNQNLTYTLVRSSDCTCEDTEENIVPDVKVHITEPASEEEESCDYSSEQKDYCTELLLTSTKPILQRSISNTKTTAPCRPKVALQRLMSSPGITGTPVGDVGFLTKNMDPKANLTDLVSVI